MLLGRRAALAEPSNSSFSWGISTLVSARRNVEPINCGAGMTHTAATILPRSLLELSNALESSRRNFSGKLDSAELLGLRTLQHSRPSVS